MNRLDVLVNNAGINIPEDFDNIKDEDWDNIIETNLKGPFYCISRMFTIFEKFSFL